MLYLSLKHRKNSLGRVWHILSKPHSAPWGFRGNSYRFVQVQLSPKLQRLIKHWACICVFRCTHGVSLLHQMLSKPNPGVNWHHVGASLPAHGPNLSNTSIFGPLWIFCVFHDNWKIKKKDAALDLVSCIYKHACPAGFKYRISSCIYSCWMTLVYRGWGFLNHACLLREFTHKLFAEAMAPLAWLVLLWWGWTEWRHCTLLPWLPWVSGVVLVTRPEHDQDQSITHCKVILWSWHFRTTAWPPRTEL